MKKQLLFIPLIIILIIISVIFYFKNWSQQNSISSPSVDQGKITENSLCLTEAPERNKEQKYEILDKLSPDVQVDFFVRLLGCPIYINHIDNEPFKEYVFVDEEYFVQAVTDLNNKVLTYAIVSRKKDFNPTFKMEGLFEVSLNKTVFSDWLYKGSTNKQCYSFKGAHDPVLYFEQSFFGNPGNYLTFLVGVNNSAPFDGVPEERYEGGDTAMYLGFVDCEKVSKDDLNKLTPNTFIVRAPFFDVKDKYINHSLFIWFGPNNIQLRTFNE